MKGTLLAFIAVALLAACGGGDDDEAEQTALSEDSLAGSLLLKVSDIPTGWSEVPEKDTPDSPFSKCDDGPASAGLTGRAESGEFARGGVTTINQTVSVFADPNAAQAAVDAYVRDRLGCVVKTFNDGGADDEDATWSDATLADVSFPGFGDASQLKRISVKGKAKKGSSEIDAYLDVLVVRKDRVAFSLIATDVFTPFGSLEDWAKRATEKLP